MILNKKRQAIFDKSGGKCWYCGCELQKGWHQDHLEPIIRVSELVRDHSNSQFSHKYVNTGECRRPHLDTIDNLISIGEDSLGLVQDSANFIAQNLQTFRYE